jgi:integrative and conjugative element protein (TIGR02256 family)
MQKRDSSGIVWIPEKVFDQMKTEANRLFPCETGGVLIGYWTEDNSEVVVTRAIGPGPKAIHRRYSFIPDAEYHEKEIARYYKESGRLHTYLGDWHTHPQSIPYPSRKDRRTLKRIATHAEARADVPLMAILGGPPWSLKVWKCKPITVLKIALIFQISPINLRVYSVE